MFGVSKHMEPDIEWSDSGLILNRPKICGVCNKNLWWLCQPVLEGRR